jgi:hypothetical protein
LESDKRPSEYPWTHLKLEKPTGTQDEVVAALRLHLKRTYSDIDFDDSITDPRDTDNVDSHPQHADIHSSSRKANENGEEDADIKMADVLSVASDSSLMSGAVTGQLHTGEHRGSVRDGAGIFISV